MPHFLERYLALTRKEIQQLRRNKRLLIQMILPPTLVLVIFGFALNPEVKHLRIGLVDESRTPASRELIAAVTEPEAFDVTGVYLSSGEANRALRALEIDMTLIIPPDYADRLAAGESVSVQALIDAVNANSAAVARAYLEQAILDYGRRLGAGVVAAEEPGVRSVILYNPGLVYPWFYVTGVMSVIVFLNGALVASAVAVREKELGTVEQLLMSPAQTAEILLAKTTPVLLVLFGGFSLAVVVARLVFDLPVRGPLAALAVGVALAGTAGTGIGVALATFSATQQQAQLLTFFMLPPLVLISGGFAPLESMPAVLKALSWLDPIRYLLIVVRGVTIKGAGFVELWPQLGALLGFAVALYGVSSWRYRRQLS